MLDGILLEKEGIPSAVVSTDAFEEQCKTMAMTHSFEEYTFITVPHPIAPESSEDLKHEADKVFYDVMGLLINR